MLTCPLTPSTEGLIGAAELAAMKPTASLINCARGPVVHEDALVAALADGAIAAAALDVTAEEPLPSSSPLWDIDNLIITSHTGGETSLYEQRLVAIIAENVRRWQRGEDFIHRVV